MGSDVMIYIQASIKIGSGIYKLTWWRIYVHSHRQDGDRIYPLYESRLKIYNGKRK